MSSTLHRVLRWSRLVVAAALVAAGGIAGSATPAAAAACSGAAGVTVVVDFGGTESTRCASGDPSSGFDALARAAFSVTRVQQFPSAVCRINGYPASDPCVQMPPTNAYWSYWHAKRGGSWSYYSAGPASTNPAPGTVEGWAFGAGAPPSVAPPASYSTPPASSSSTSAKPQGATSSSIRPPSGSTPRASAPPIPPPPKGSRILPTSATTSATTAAANGTAPTTASSSDRALSPVSAHTGGGAGPGGLLAGLAVIAVLGAGAGVVVWRRRAA